MTAARRTPAPIDRLESLRLMRTESIGRVVYTLHALPAIMPVAFTTLDEDILVRVDGASQLAIAARGAVVAFEVDRLDPGTHAGWSVAIIGRCTIAVDPLARSAPDGCSASDDDNRAGRQCLAIHADLVTGHYLTLAEP